MRPYEGHLAGLLEETFFFKLTNEFNFLPSFQKLQVLFTKNLKEPEFEG